MSYISDDGFYHLFNPDEPLKEKLFFNLHIYALQQEDNLYLVFSKDGHQSLLASRALPGQTLTEAISKELKESLDVDKWEFFGEIQFADEARDNQGMLIKRVDVYVAVPFFETKGRQVVGMDLEWQTIKDDADAFQSHAGLDRITFYSRLVDAIIMQRQNMGIPDNAWCKMSLTWDNKFIDENLLDREYGSKPNYHYPSSEDLMLDSHCDEIVIYYEQPISESFVKTAKHKKIGKVNIALLIDASELKKRDELKGIREQLIFP